MKWFCESLLDGKKEEIPKSKARELLSGYWKEECLEDIFNNEKVFRLSTPYRTIWSKTDDGKVLMAGFEGISE